MPRLAPRAVLLRCCLWAGLLLAGPAAQALAPDESVRLQATGSVEVAFSPWNDPEEAILAAFEEARELILVQAYLFTSKPLLQGLLDAKARGVKVEVLLDADMNRPGSYTVLPELLEAGIPVALETRYANAHNKVVILDPHSPSRAALITGSYNFTRAAKTSNAENLLILRGNPALVRVYLENWKRHKDEAQILRKQDAEAWRRGKANGRKSDRTASD